MHLSNSVEWELWNDVEWSVDMESEFFIESLGFKLVSFVKIDDLPSLVNTFVVILNINWFTFYVFGSSQYSLVVLEVDEVRSTVLEQLPPSWIGAPDLHIIWLSWALNVPRLIVVLGSDGQSLLMEVPHLSVSSIGGFEDEVSVVDQIEISVWFHLSYNVEWSFDVQAKLFVKLSFSWFSFPFIGIDNVPLLVKTITWVVYTNVSVLLVNIADNL
jgi:hypothetical protein